MFLTRFLLLILLVSFQAAKAQEASIIPSEIKSLISTPYELAAHYLPPIVMRVIMYSNLPFGTKDFQMERNIYEKTSAGDILIETMKINLDVKKDKILSREIIGFGKINNQDLLFSNKLNMSLTTKGDMDILCSIDGKQVMDLDVKLDGKSKTTAVEGKLFDKNVSYKTTHRSTEGSIGDKSYKMYVEGIRDKDKKVVGIKSEGSIGEYKINGYASKIDEKNYLIEENYGPLLVKTKLKVIDDDVN